MKSKKYLLQFEPRAVEVPLTSRIISEFGLEVNILRAEITESGGKMVVTIEGPPGALGRGLRYLEDNEVKISELRPLVRKEDQLCTDCGMCVSICPAKAYSIFPPEWKVVFAEEKCIACGLCRDVCPPGAIFLSGI
jgi:ferredoxin